MLCELQESVLWATDVPTFPGTPCGSATKHTSIIFFFSIVHKCVHRINMAAVCFAQHAQMA